LAPKIRVKPCPACGGKDFKEHCPSSFLKNDKRWIMECTHCRFSILWPLPSAKELNTFYSQGYYDFNRASEEGKGWYWSRLLKRIKDKGRFLDVGCATGFFINGIRQNCDWEVFGLETGSGAAAYARKEMGLKVKDVPLEKAKYPRNYFDFIHINNVLEHVPDPPKVLAEAAKILKPGGILYMAVPNGRTDRYGYWDFHQKFKQRAASMDGHLSFFSPLSLSLLAGKAGLKIEKVYGCGPKRALKVLGYWPRKKDWMRAYQGREAKVQTVEEAVNPGKSRPKLYYLYKHGSENLFRFPGFFKWSYDFNLYLTK